MKRKYIKPEAVCLDQDLGCILCLSYINKEGGDPRNTPGYGGNGSGGVGARQDSFFEDDDDDF